MNTLLDRLQWAIRRRRPGLMPAELRRRILALSPYLCAQIGQGSPMVVMRRTVWEAGGYEELPGAPLNRAGEDWIIRRWLADHPHWRP